MKPKYKTLSDLNNFWIAAAASLLIAGLMGAWWTADRADRQMRHQQAQKARLVARALNIHQIRGLTGTPADLSNPGYRSLKDQFVSIRKADDKCRFLYLMGRKSGGAVFFHVDSESPESKDYSPPGQVYDEASPVVRQTFKSRAESVEGPVSDRWGTWVTALVPVIDSSTGELIAVLGMDVDARTWRSEVVAQAALPVGLMMALLILLVLGMMLIRSRAQLRGSWSHQRLLLENIDAGVVIIDAETHVIERVNKKGEELFGGTRDLIVGRVCHLFLCPAEKGKCPVTEQGQHVDNSDRILLKADGSQLPILKSIRRIRSSTSPVAKKRKRNCWRPTGIWRKPPLWRTTWP
jgi:PAS domain-containing protein